jgi:hypothetical protein
MVNLIANSEIGSYGCRRASVRLRVTVPVIFFLLLVSMGMADGIPARSALRCATLFAVFLLVGFVVVCAWLKRIAIHCFVI